ncbi:hypothetical protein QFC19_008442 [Naganishia cerealis]|uniref:Uncharacterized protein n=1 Tax=Naganishia cerealis TaxID=610337 RepID=A0ACC2V3L1_9TREE|nr:hypothetical protein QFC19_008442 [Naganishia cerealis]
MSAQPPHTEEEFDSYWSHGWKKCKKQPLVPLESPDTRPLPHGTGIVATCIALMGATGALRSGNRAQFNKYLRYRVAAQGVTVVAAVAGTLMLTNKADDLRDSQRRTALGELPPSIDLVPSSLSSATGNTVKNTSDTALPAPSIQTSSSSSSATEGTTGTGRFARPMRISQALEETEKLPGAHRAPIKVSEFHRRLERAEQLEGEVERARAGKGQ